MTLGGTRHERASRPTLPDVGASPQPFTLDGAKTMRCGKESRVPALAGPPDGSPPAPTWQDAQLWPMMCRMGRIFAVEDELHAEWMGQFSSKKDALAFLDRLRAEPDCTENRAPCTSWRSCGRKYWLLEYEDNLPVWRMIASEPAFEVRGGTVRPIATYPST